MNSDGIIKGTLDTDDNVLELVRNLWEQVRKNNAQPTQVIFGKRVFELALRDPTLSQVMVIESEPYGKNTGKVGYFAEFELLTDFYNYSNVMTSEDDEQGKEQIDNGWSIEENTVAFNLGEKLQGNI